VRCGCITVVTGAVVADGVFTESNARYQRYRAAVIRVRYVDTGPSHLALLYLCQHHTHQLSAVQIPAVGVLTPENKYEGSEYVLTPPLKISHSFIQNCCLIKAKFH